MRLWDYLDTYELTEAIKYKRVRVATHESLPLSLYTYTDRAQFEGIWTDAERKCRGLVVEDTGEIVAWCMPKFFNYSEHVNGKSYAPPVDLTEDFEIFCKMDGSMGTVFYYDDNWHVASKGSFHSDQAVWATKYLRNKMKASYESSGLATRDGFDPLDKFTTYVCEIIYPDNRIVVDYKGLEDLVLLTAYDTASGTEWAREGLEARKLEWGWIGSIVPSYNPWSINLDELQLLADENVCLDENNGDHTVSGLDHEGYVVRLRNGTRVKVKIADYLHLHKTLTNCNERSIWENLKDGLFVEDICAAMPDEFQDWVRKVAANLYARLNKLHASIYLDWELLWPLRVNRKDFALAALKTSHPSAMFLLVDNKTEKLLEWEWDQIKPEYTRGFFQDSEA